MPLDDDSAGSSSNSSNSCDGVSDIQTIKKLHQRITSEAMSDEDENIELEAMSDEDEDDEINIENLAPGALNIPINGDNILHCIAKNNSIRTFSTLNAHEKYDAAILEAIPIQNANGDTFLTCAVKSNSDSDGHSHLVIYSSLRFERRKTSSVKKQRRAALAETLPTQNNAGDTVLHLLARSNPNAATNFEETLKIILKTTTLIKSREQAYGVEIITDEEREKKNQKLVYKTICLKNKDNKTPLEVAVNNKNLELMRFLLRAALPDIGESFTGVAYNGDTHLHQFAQQPEEVKAAKSLIEQMGNQLAVIMINLPNVNNETPFSIALENDNIELIIIFIVQLGSHSKVIPNYLNLTPATKEKLNQTIMPKVLDVFLEKLIAGEELSEAQYELCRTQKDDLYKHHLRESNYMNNEDVRSNMNNPAHPLGKVFIDSGGQSPSCIQPEGSSSSSNYKIGPAMYVSPKKHRRKDPMNKFQQSILDSNPDDFSGSPSFSQ